MLNLIFNYALCHIDEAHFKKREVGYMSPSELLVAWREEKENIKYSKARAEMDV